MMGGGSFNKNPSEQSNNQNMIPNNNQQNQGIQNFMNSMPGNSLMNFGMGAHQMPAPSFEPSEVYNYGSMGQVIFFFFKEFLNSVILYERIPFIRTI